MSFLQELSAGTYGVVARVPSSFTLLGAGPTAALLEDPERGVRWQMWLQQLPIDLSEEHEELLRRDIAHEARILFAQHTRELNAQQGNDAKEPLRIDDASWTPVISVERALIGNVSALVVCHRLVYQPGAELVAGRIIVPVGRAALVIVVTAFSNLTGMREAMLYEAAQSKRDRGPSARDEVPSAHLTQEAMDDPAHDNRFPEHPLTGIRKMTEWVVAGGLEIDVREPLPKKYRLTHLRPFGLAVASPPRFMAARELCTSDRAVFIRSALPPAPGRMLDIAVAKERLEGIALVSWRLKRRAEIMMQARCAAFGAKDVSVEVTELPRFVLGTRVRVYARYTGSAGPFHAVGDSFIESGRVFAVTCEGDVEIPRAEFEEAVEAAISSLSAVPGNNG